MKENFDRLPVVLDHEFKEIVSRDGVVDILCRTSPSKIGKGAWTFYVTDPEDNAKLQLITHGKSRPKVYTSIAGVASFLRELGFMDVVIPIYEGRNIELSEVDKKPKS